MHTVENIFFLDLEQTIIDCWDNAELIQVPQIKRWLNANGATSVSIFSFAIWNDADKHRFDGWIRPQIERALGMPVDTWPSVQDMIKADYDHTGIKFESGHEVSEYIQLRGKKDGFINYVLCRYDFKRAVLIDDVVPDLTLSHRHQGWSIELWNVDRL